LKTVTFGVKLFKGQLKRQNQPMFRKLILLILIALIGYIFYEEFVADSLEPVLKGVAEKPVFYQVRVPKVASEDQSLQQLPN
jgi:hypothetical protein